MLDHVLTALPVYNEQATVANVLTQVLAFSQNVLVVDDGSTDATPAMLSRFRSLHVIRHAANRGYGAALRSAFQHAIDSGYQTLVTIDCDGQHEPQRIPIFAESCDNCDIVSGSRYLQELPGGDPAPWDRRQINRVITEELNRRLGLHLTDAFCGFKAYRVEALRQLRISELGYAMPLQLWCQAARLGLRIRELAIPRIYLDANRSFGGPLDNARTRLQYYRQVIDGNVVEPTTVCDAVPFVPSGHAV